ncbi:MULTISPECIES: heavy-metal-associated domain-containing protein [Brevibacillus]|uniref:heavy-metal-associated domain-containing protein n=1 Tax=Brevibacillus TaxID=55080 RepID=UPI0020408D65|nr:heavy-metal-associated domain-containing protein [Brevibacillus borstelensis]MCM3473496.1 heavy-metal-associated domain-containing protein [Brevibacillus borstelensis]
MQNKTIHIQGMTDQDAAKRVQSIIRDVWGVRQVHVDTARGEVQVLFDEKAASIRDFEQAIIDGGFQVEARP